MPRGQPDARYCSGVPESVYWLCPSQFLHNRNRLEEAYLMGQQIFQKYGVGCRFRSAKWARIILRALIAAHMAAWVLAVHPAVAQCEQAKLTASDAARE